MQRRDFQIIEIISEWCQRKWKSDNEHSEPVRGNDLQMVNGNIIFVLDRTEIHQKGIEELKNQKESHQKEIKKLKNQYVEVDKKMVKQNPPNELNDDEKHFPELLLRVNTNDDYFWLNDRENVKMNRISVCALV